MSADDACPDCGGVCYYAPGYPWCRSCREHHREPECPIDQEGYALAQCGCRWVDIENVEGPHPSPSCAWVDL